MKRKVFTIALATLLVVGTISIAVSQGRGRGGKNFGQGLGIGQRMMDGTPAELNLTQEQQEKLQSLRTDSAKETLPLRNEIQIKTLELRQLWIADELDEEAILAKSKEISDLRDQLHEQRIHHRLDAAKILTKEQRTRFSPAGRWGGGYQYGCEAPGYGYGGRRRHGRGGNFGMGRGHRRNW